LLQDGNELRYLPVALSTLYFELTLKERMALVKHLLKNSSLAEEETSEPALVGQYQPVERA
jgi:hypothetical protein